MMKVEILIVGILLSSVSALPRAFGNFNKAPIIPEETQSSSKVENLGELESLHAVTLTSHPSDNNLLVYADETAVYDFNKATGESRLISGSESTGLITSRQSVDGSDARFKYITKLVTIGSNVYVFDYDRLRKLNPENKVVSTVMVLSTEQEDTNPITGAITSDLSRVYWTTTAGQGHFVVSQSLKDESDKEVITAGPTLIGYMELSSDESSLFMSDVQMKMIEKVDIKTGDIEILGHYGSANFMPGALAVRGNSKLIVIDVASDSLEEFDLATPQSDPNPLCTDCQFSGPVDFYLDGDQIFVLDSKPHPIYRTYKFSIKKLNLGGAVNQPKLQGNSDRNDIQSLMKFYNKAFARFLKFNR